VVAEVGEIKTEIAYHGDTINTAARIQEQCNVLKQRPSNIGKTGDQPTSKLRLFQ